MDLLLVVQFRVVGHHDLPQVESRAIKVVSLLLVLLEAHQLLPQKNHEDSLVIRQSGPAKHPGQGSDRLVFPALLAFRGLELGILSGGLGLRGLRLLHVLLVDGSV